MKVILQTPCCGANIEVEHEDPDVLAKMLTTEMNRHYSGPVFKCATMGDWWAVCAQLKIGLILEDGESVEDEYERVMYGLNLLERMEVMATFGLILGVDLVMSGKGSATPLNPIPDANFLEMSAFETGVQVGSSSALDAGMEGRFPPEFNRSSSALMEMRPTDDVIFKPMQLEELTSVPLSVTLH